MKLPVGISAPIATAILGGVTVAGEVGLSHPLHQAIVIVAMLALGLLGYFTIGGTAALAGEQAAPPFSIPSPLPQSSAAAPPSRAAVDEAAAAAREQGLP